MRRGLVCILPTQVGFEVLIDWFGVRHGGIVSRALVACSARRSDLALGGALIDLACDPRPSLTLALSRRERGLKRGLENGSRDDFDAHPLFL